MLIRKPTLKHGSVEYALFYHHFIPGATYEMTPVLTIRDFADLLMEDLRIDEADLLTLDVEKLTALSDRYRSRNIKKLVSLIRRMQK